MQDEHSPAERPRDLDTPRQVTPESAASAPLRDRPRQLETPSRNGCRLLMLGMVAFAAASPCLLCCGGWYYLQRQARKALKVELTRIRDQEGPFEISEILKPRSWHQDKPEAAKYWLQAFEALDDPQFIADFDAIEELLSGVSPAPAPGKAWPKKQVADRLVTKHARALTLLRQAREQGVGVFPISFSVDKRPEFAGLSAARRAISLLRLKAYCAAHNGDTSGAAAALMDTLGLARLLQRQPTIRPQIAGFACIESAWSSLQDLMPGNNWNQQDLIAVQSAFVQGRTHSSLSAALLGERALAIAIFRYGDNIALEQLAEGPEDILQAEEIQQPEDLLYALQNYRKLIQAMQKPFAKTIPIFQTIEDEMEQESRGLGSVRYPVTNAIFPNAAAVLIACASTHARHITAYEGIALERFRQVTGVFPQELRQLEGQSANVRPLDPFDSQPLRYLAPANRTDPATVYSVGQNLVDDNGDPAEDADGIPLDLVFRVTSSPRQIGVPPLKK
ncbi:hypothetical protein [Lignipirellula cremea]|uniref:Uncharacterized protein n=1 Tax=Lignipirellula cremea TaxID=2528010 RepID=A0A518DTZ0_9BACT|nr:hypothetical protein [Lignipirellula cremea]QDU95296.1 hypothetical protein Pla8534_31110 [Lignipirellula cremea]